MKITCFPIILLIVFLAIFFPSQTTLVELDGQKIIVELAETSEERQKGLMFREELCSNCGMLFVFEEETNSSFWMKNMLIPIDIIFINKDNVVVDIHHATPCEKEPCKLYPPKENAKYVLETNFNKFDETIIGQKLKF